MVAPGLLLLRRAAALTPSEAAAAQRCGAAAPDRAVHARVADPAPSVCEGNGVRRGAKAELQVFVDIDGQFFCAEVGVDAVVGDIRRQLSHEIGVRGLAFRQRRVDDATPLADAGVGAEAVLTALPASFTWHETQCGGGCRILCPDTIVGNSRAPRLAVAHGGGVGTAEVRWVVVVAAKEPCLGHWWGAGGRLERGGRFHAGVCAGSYDLNLAPFGAHWAVVVSDTGAIGGPCRECGGEEALPPVAEVGEGWEMALSAPRGPTPRLRITHIPSGRRRTVEPQLPKGVLLRPCVGFSASATALRIEGPL